MGPTFFKCFLYLLIDDDNDDVMMMDRAAGAWRGVVSELIHKILTEAANVTRDSLKADKNVDDRGALTTLATELYSYVAGSSEVDVGVSVARFFDRLFAAVYLPATARPSAVECVAAVRRGGARGDARPRR